MVNRLLGKTVGNALDASAIGALLGVLGDLLTVWASMWTIAWLSIRFYESRTFARIRDWWQEKKDKGNYDYGEHPGQE